MPHSKGRIVHVGSIPFGGQNPFVLIAGPCVIETEKKTLSAARYLRELTDKLHIPFVFKSSYDKANRTSAHSYRGPGFKQGLAVLQKVKRECAVPILVDVHQIAEVDEAAAVADVLQVPAFLCRQTDLILAVANTGKVVNIKKGQFLAPWDVINIVKKVESAGNYNILLTERGTSFGYNNLVADMRSLIIMKRTGYPVIFDATHSVQLPGAGVDRSDGQKEFVPALSRAAAAVGIDGLFLEVHAHPEKALSDGANMLSFRNLPLLLKEILEINKVLFQR